MKKNWLSLFFVGFIGLTAFFIFKGEKHEIPAPEIDFSKASQLGKLSNKAPVLSSNEELPVYERTPIKRPLYIADLQKIDALTFDLEGLEKLTKEIKQRNLSEQGDFAVNEAPKWDLNKLPNDNQEFKLMLEEAQWNALGKISQAAIDGDLTALKNLLGGLKALRIVGKLELQGYDENGQMVLRFPENYSAWNNSFIKKKREKLKTRKVATGHAGEITVEADKKFNLEALFEEKLVQTPYFSNPSDSSAKLDEYWGGDSHLFNSISDAADFLINSLSNADIFRVSPDQAQEKIEKIVGNTLDDARVNPGDYGVFNVADLHDVSDLDYEIFAEAVSREIALRYAVLGAGLSTFLGDQIVNRLQGARIFAAGLLVSIGVESLFAALGSYWGTYLLLLLHRYQTYIRDAKEVILNRGEEFVISKIPPFDPNIVFYSETTRIEMNKSWLWGFGFGFITKQFVTMNNIKRLTGWVAIHLATLAHANNIVAKIIGKSVWGLIVVSGTSIGQIGEAIVKTIAKLIGLPLTGKGGVVRAILGWVRDFAKLTPARVATIFADLLLTGLVIYGAVHTRMFAASQMFSRVYQAPEMAVHLALNDKWHGHTPFVEASREHFYKLCYFMATADLNSQKMTPVDGVASSRIRDIKDEQVKNCLQIIGAFENQPEARVISHMQNLVGDKKLAPETLTLYTENRPLEASEVVDDIVTMYAQYPEYYRSIWTTAIKSIYPNGFVPEQFYSVKNLLIQGKGGEIHENYSSYFEFSSFRGADKINAVRFEYVIERLAFRAREMKVAEEKATPDSPLDMAEAFEVFWKFHSSNVKTYDAEVLAFLRAEEKGFWGRLWDGVKSAKAHLSLLFNRWKNPIYNTTYRFQAEEGIEAALENR